jgi:hypothetical protein
MPQQLSAIDNAESNFCVLSAEGNEGHLLYSTDVGAKQKGNCVIDTFVYLRYGSS